MCDDEVDPVFLALDSIKSQTLELYREAKSGNVEAKKSLKKMNDKMMEVYRAITGEEFNVEEFQEERQGDSCLFCSQLKEHHRSCPAENKNHDAWHRGYDAGKAREGNIFDEGSTEWLGWVVGMSGGIKE